MRNKALILVLSISFSCNLIDRNEDAITLVQESKYEMTSPLDAYMFMATGSKFTNLELANFIAQNKKELRFSWKALDQGNDIYLVSFEGDKDRKPIWEADLKNKIVRYVNNDAGLKKKYNITD